MATAGQFKRAVFEWSGMAALAAALACLGYWAVSLVSDRADSAMSFRELGLDVSVSGGAVAVSYTASISLLVPALGFGLIAAVCIWSWIRAVKRLARASELDARQAISPLD